MIQLLWTIAILIPTITAQCTPYTGFVCSAMIPFNTPVFSNSIPNLEVTLLSTSTLSLLKQIVQHTNPKCAQAFMAYTCATTFPVCTNTTTNENVLRSVMPCQSSCQLVNQACASVAVLQNLLPNCSANITGTDIPLPTSNCLDLSQKLVTLTSSNNSDSASIVCPSPLIPNPDPFAVNQPAGCIGSCCLACPIINNFYDETAFQTFNYWSQGIRFVSFFMATLLLLSYAFLPNKRNHPNAILFFFFIALWLFFLPNVLGWRGRKANQCFDSVTPSSQFNNKMCLAQGFILIFSTHSVVMWIFCLALNLHLAAVWKSTFLSTRYYISHIIAWGIPLAFSAAAAVLGGIGSETTPTCFIIREWSNELLFYPLGVFVYGATFLFGWTLLFIAKLSCQAEQETITSTATGKESFTAYSSRSQMTVSDGLQKLTLSPKIRAVKSAAKTVFKLQWRTVFLTIEMLLTFIFVWVFYMTQLSKIDMSISSSWFLQWIKCIETTNSNAQSFCSSQIGTGNLPAFGLMVANDVIPGAMGIIIFFIIGCRYSLFHEWYQFFKNAFTRR